MDKEKKPIIIETADIYLHFPYIMEEEADDLADFLEEEHIEYEGATDIFIDLQNQVKKQKEVIDRILNETKETRDILNNNRDDNMLSKCCLLSYLEIVENLLKEVSE